MRLAVLAAAVMAYGASACATPAGAEPETYVIDAGHTHVTFAVERFGFADTIGVFPDSEGVIVIDRDDPSASSVTASVDATTVWTGLEARDDIVRSEHWLNAAAHPRIRFASTSVELIDQENARVTGDFTLLGVTAPVIFDVRLNRAGPDATTGGRAAIGFSVRGVVKRSDFGHTLALGPVGDTVTIAIETIAHRREP